MTADRGLDNEVRRLRRRVRLLLVERYALFGCSAGMLVCAAFVVLASRFTVLLDYRLWAGTIAGGLAIGAVFGLLRRLNDLTVAISADRRTGMKERLSTAVAIERSDELHDLERAVVADAGEHFSGLSPSQVFRHRFGVPHLALGVSLAILLAVYIIPQIPAFHSKQRQQEIAVMKAEGKKIVKVAKEVKKAAPRDEEDLKNLGARLEKLGRKMQSGRMPKKQAMLQVGKLSKEIKEAQDRLAKKNSATKSMAEAGKEAREAARELAKSMAEKMAKEKGIPLDEAMKKVASDERLAELARKDGKLTQAEMKELEKLVSKYADPRNSLPIPSELAEALAKLMENEDYRKAMELMQQLAEKLNSGKLNDMDKEQLQKQLDALAKALQNTDLDKLAKQLLENAQKLAQMSPEELDRLLEQIKQAQQMAQALKDAGGG